ncbi:MAG: phosphoglucosamine mutase [Acidimicrobiales bacterium]
MSLSFGTDGVRGPAEAFTADFVHALGRAAARVLGGDHVVIGRDPRASGPRIEALLAAAFEAEGHTVERLGVVPTPAVACLSAAEEVPGAMISASHNPFGDNGIKLFAPGGLKLPDATEAQLAAELEGLLAGGDDLGDAGDDATAEVADAQVDHGRVERYEQVVVDSIEGRRLDGLDVVIDCANGAASVVAPEVLTRLGARVTTIHASPDGRNINDGCGSTHPEDLQAAVVASEAHVGLAFDGDADRVLAVDERGRLIDGDQLLAMLAIDRRDRGLLPHDTVVVTVMSNLGFRLGMADHAIRVLDTKVGDRYVLEAIEAGGYGLGGEQSGHLIFRDLATTGDGLLSAVQVLDLLGRTGRYLSDLADSAMERLPQVLRNVRVARRDADIATHIAGAIAAEELVLGPRGRVLVRPSGTEPLVRVMVEAADHDLAEAVAERLVAAVVEVAGLAD